MKIMFNGMECNYYLYNLCSIIEEMENQFKDEFFDTVIVFGGGTGIIGAIQFVTGYIFVCCLNYAAEGQVSLSCNNN